MGEKDKIEKLIEQMRKEVESGEYEWEEAFDRVVKVAIDTAEELDKNKEAFDRIVKVVIEMAELNKK